MQELIREHHYKDLKEGIDYLSEKEKLSDEELYEQLIDINNYIHQKIASVITFIGEYYAVDVISRHDLKIGSIGFPFSGEDGCETLGLALQKYGPNGTESFNTDIAKGLNSARLTLAGIRYYLESLVSLTEGDLALENKKVITVRTFKQKLIDYLKARYINYFNKIKLSINGNDDTEINCIKGDLFILFQNIFKNVISHGAGTNTDNIPDTFHLDIRITETSSHTIFEIKDDGAGLSEKYASNPNAILEYGTTRKKNKKYSGIGLRDISQRGYEMTVNGNEGLSNHWGGKGLSMTLKMPKTTN